MTKMAELRYGWSQHEHQPWCCASVYAAQAGCARQVIYVPDGFEVREGLKLTKDYKVLCPSAPQSVATHSDGQ